MDRLLGREPRCWDHEACELKPGHLGFHKAPHAIWPNESDPPEYWIGLGAHIMLVGPILTLSKKEIDYAVSAYRDRE